MSAHIGHGRAFAAVGAFFTVAIVVSGVLFLISRDTGDTSSPGTADTVAVEVFFHRGQNTDPGMVSPVKRQVAASARVAESTLAALLAGPTEAEQAQGYWSHFSARTAGLLNTLRIANDVAHADFRDFSKVIPSASSSAGSAALLAELDTTLRQFPAICASVYSFDGNVSGFYEWLQMVAPNKMAPGAAEARKAALKFATDILGLENPADKAIRWISETQSEVDVAARIPDDRAAGPLTIVSLRRDAKAWTVTGARTRIIQVTSPTASKSVSSPLSVSGLSAVWEGVTTLRILETKGTKATELGRGTVIGGGDTMHPFSGSVTFTTPGAPAGWAVFTSASGHNGETAAGTAIPVRFAAVAAPPQVIDFQLTPTLATQDGWINLTGSDAVTFVLRTDRADRVRFFLNPVSSWNTPQVIPLGTATRSGDVFTLTWHYLDEPLLARLSAVLSGPGGSTETMPFGLFHL